MNFDELEHYLNERGLMLRRITMTAELLAHILSNARVRQFMDNQLTPFDFTADLGDDVSYVAVGWWFASKNVRHLVVDCCPKDNARQVRTLVCLKQAAVPFLVEFRLKSPSQRQLDISPEDDPVGLVDLTLLRQLSLPSEREYSSGNR